MTRLRLLATFMIKNLKDAHAGQPRAYSFAKPWQRSVEADFAERVCGVELVYR